MPNQTVGVGDHAPFDGDFVYPAEHLEDLIFDGTLPDIDDFRGDHLAGFENELVGNDLEVDHHRLPEEGVAAGNGPDDVLALTGGEDLRRFVEVLLGDHLQSVVGLALDLGSPLQGGPVDQHQKLQEIAFRLSQGVAPVEHGGQDDLPRPVGHVPEAHPLRLLLVGLIELLVGFPEEDDLFVQVGLRGFQLIDPVLDFGADLLQVLHPGLGKLQLLLRLEVFSHHPLLLRTGLFQLRLGFIPLGHHQIELIGHGGDLLGQLIGPGLLLEELTLALLIADLAGGQSLLNLFHVEQGRSHILGDEGEDHQGGRRDEDAGENGDEDGCVLGTQAKEGQPFASDLHADPIAKVGNDPAGDGQDHYKHHSIQPSSPPGQL